MQSLFLARSTGIINILILGGA